MELRSLAGTVLGVTGERYDTIDATLPELTFEEFPLLAGVDPYGDTMFNRIQMAPLAAEFARLLEDAPPKRAKMLTEVIKLCHEGNQISDSQLWIIGD